MFIIKCSSCGFEIKDEKQLRLYGGTEIALDLLQVKGSPADVKRKAASLFNQKNIPCPKCKKTDIWVWI